MDNTKRIILAIVLCVIVMYGWNFLFPPPEAPPAPAEEQTGEAAPAPAGDAQSAPPAESQAGGAVTADLSLGREISVDTPLYHAVINSAGGYLLHFQLKEYTTGVFSETPFDMVDDDSVPLAPMGLYLGGEATWAAFSWNNGVLTSTADGYLLTLTGTRGSETIIRRLTFSNATYLIHEDVEVRGADAQDLAFSMATRTLSGKEVKKGGEIAEEESRYDMTRVSFLGEEQGLKNDQDKEDLETEPLTAAGAIYWGGIQSNYFLMAMVPEQEARFTGGASDNVFTARMAVSLSDQGTSSHAACTYYLGPKQKEALEQGPESLAAARDFGWFDFIAKPLLAGINFFHTYVKNYGIAIIIMTIIIKLVLWPLSQKSYRSMNQMKKIQPLIAKIREKYKDDRQKMNQELMGLYKTYKVNPAGGCFPMLLQIPVFIGLYQALLNAIELRHAAFIPHVPFTDIIWLADLSAKDPFYVTPIIMGLTMFIQQRLSPSMGDPTQAKIMMIMPIVFTFIFLSFPAGLVVYWLTNNILSIAQQKMLMREKKA